MYTYYFKKKKYAHSDFSEILSYRASPGWFMDEVLLLSPNSGENHTSQTNVTNSFQNTHFLSLLLSPLFVIELTGKFKCF